MRLTEEHLQEIAREARDEIRQYLDKPIYLPEAAVDPILDAVLRAVKRTHELSVGGGF